MNRFIKKRYIFLAFIGYLVWALIYSSNPEKSLGNDYFLEDDRYSIYNRFPNGVPDIPPTVVNYNYNRRYIIAKQNLNGEWPDPLYFEDYDYHRLYMDEDTYKRYFEDMPGSDTIFEYITTRDYYWIIDKQESSFYGPMQLEEFKAKCDSLNIKLTFNSIFEKKLRPKR